MRNMSWMVLALLAVSMTAAAQQTAAAPQNSQTVQSVQTPPPPAPETLPPPTTMDQVADRAILREKALVKYLAKRTPIVETYLQNLVQDPQLGPVPKDDRYFLGRMDLSD